jgi:hypothetical protein
MFGKNRLAMVNLDKRETVHLYSLSKMLSTTNHIGPDKRGQFHDSFLVNKTEALTAHYTWMGYSALLAPRDEMGDMLSVPDAEKNVRNYSLYGSWYGDRIISYEVSGNNYSSNGNNPFKSATNDFANITNQVSGMGSDLLTHFKILGE